MASNEEVAHRLQITETAFDAMRLERDRFAHENTELQRKITNLKETVRGEAEVRAKTENELEVLRSAWKTESRTKEALAQLAMPDTDIIAQYEFELKQAKAKLDELKQAYGDLVARLDRDGGQAFGADASVAVTSTRIDRELVRLQTADTDLKLAHSAAQTTEGVLKMLRAFLPILTDEKREVFFYEAERGYCGACGRRLQEEETSCQCTNDE